MNLDDLIEQAAQAMLDFRDNIRKIVEPLSDDDLLMLAQECRRLSQPNDTCNFPMPEWERIASIIQGEHASRLMVREAEAHMKATGESYYCPHCRGSCTPAHLAELDDAVN